MSTALNDRDAILQAASVRVINPKNASILMSASTSLFHLNAAGAVDVPAITITATLIGLEGDVTFTVDGAALTSVTGKTAVGAITHDTDGPGRHRHCAHPRRRTDVLAELHHRCRA
jgi:uncharacterized protein YabE (DUF348 family)